MYGAGTHSHHYQKKQSKQKQKKVLHPYVLIQYDLISMKCFWSVVFQNPSPLLLNLKHISGSVTWLLVPLPSFKEGHRFKRLVSFLHHQRLWVRPDTAEVSSSSRQCLTQPPLSAINTFLTAGYELWSNLSERRVWAHVGGMMYIKAKGNNK